MAEYTVKASQVLIVPGYTNDEIIALSAQTKNSSASALKNATKSDDKTTSSDKTGKTDTSKKSNTSSKTGKQNKKTTVTSSKNKSNKTTKSTGNAKTNAKTDNASSKSKTTNKTYESTAATGVASAEKIEKPKALLFSPDSVEFTAHRPDYEEFNGADGLVLIEKACDQYAELQLSLSVHQAMRIQENGTLELSSDDKRSIDIITEGAPTILDEETQLGHFIQPEQYTDSYIEIRRSFFDLYKNRPLTLVSDLFPTIPVCYITDLNYNINEGEEQAEWSITFREVANTWN